MQPSLPPRRAGRAAVARLSVVAVLAAGGAAADPVPYTALLGGGAALGAPATVVGASLRQALDAAQAGDVTRAEAMQAGLSDPVARKLVTWAMVDSAGGRLAFSVLDDARRELWGWPREGRREAAAEKAIGAAGLPPAAVVTWFADREPRTAEGAMTLAAALQAEGRAVDGQALLRRAWRERVFEAEPQARMLARFGGVIAQADVDARLDLLLYGQQGPAARALIPLASRGMQAVAAARIALRADRGDAAALADAVPAALQNEPGLAFDRARFYRKRDLDIVAVGYLRQFAAEAPIDADLAAAVWQERRALMNAALKSGDVQGAYLAASAHGLQPGPDYAEAEFFAGWIALTRLHDPARAAGHFAAIQNAGSAPITVSRALYWRGRAAEAQGDAAGAQRDWSEGGQYTTAFYGQLSANRAGLTTLALGRDPVPTPNDRARFDGREMVRAARLLADAGKRDAFRAFLLCLGEALPSAEEYALLVDLARADGDQDLAMRVVRAGAMRGFVLPERGYPVRAPPAVLDAPEPALTMAIIRQESGFDPGVRSGVGARGLMQLMPSTASIVAHRAGLGYSPGRLDEPEYNMTLGAAYLGQLVQTMGGSYVMAAAAYNAGPGRPLSWIQYCGDPRGGAADPADFVECIPFSETRNYVMRVMEATEVYRARLAGGSAPLTLAADLKRGAWTPAVLASPAGAGRPPSAPFPYTALTH